MDDPTRLQQSQRQRLSWRQWALGALVVLGVLFIALNSEKVDVNFIVGSTQMPLAIALLIATGVGALIGWLAPHVPRRKKQDPGAGQS